VLQYRSHLRALESQSIAILRETAAGFEKPVLLYSIGKDSSVLLHLAKKAFPHIPFPLLHIDTTWKFREMIAFRDRVVRENGLRLITYTNESARKSGINPFSSGSLYTDLMKTQALRDALEAGALDAAIGGARRDEERSRAKERVFSVRSNHRWDPKAQRPELWDLFNLQLRAGQSMRVFPLSDWTELDVWRYIALENIEVVPLYFAKMRPIVVRDGAILMKDDDRMQLSDRESVQMRSVRFRTLGCYPLTGAIESQAKTVREIIAEMEVSRMSERQGRLIDHDQSASMEKKKVEGYF